MTNIKVLATYQGYVLKGLYCVNHRYFFTLTDGMFKGTQYENQRFVIERKRDILPFLEDLVKYMKESV